MKKDYKVSKEQAEKEFEDFADTMDLDIDIDSMDMEDKKDFENIKKKLIKSIMIGSLIFNDNSEPVFTPQRSGEESKILTFKEPKGATLLSMDKMKKNQDMGKMFAIMAEMTSTDSKTFSKLVMSDFKVCQGIVSLFLG